MMKHAVLLIASTVSLMACTQVQEHQFKEVARASFEDVLSDAQTARFRNERVVWAQGSDERLALCGEVNAKNLMGAYVGWKRFVVEGSVSGSSKPFTVGPLIEDAGYLQGEFRRARDYYCGG